MSGQKNRPDRGRKAPNSAEGRTTSANPQYLGRYLVTSPPEGNPQPGSPSVLNPKGHKTQAHPRNIASRPAANIQKGKSGKGRPQNDGTRPVANHPEATSPEPQLESSKVPDPKGLEASASPKTFRTSTPRPISPQLAVSPRQQIHQERHSLPRRHSTGELPARDKLANKFVMGIPKQRFGTGKRRDSTASAAPIMTAEYCGDPFRTAIKERLAAGKPRAPPGSEFAIDSRVYHMAAENANKAWEMHKWQGHGWMKQALSSIAGMGYAIVAILRKTMRDRWVGYDEFATYPGHCQAIKYNIRMMMGFFEEAMPTMTASRYLSINPSDIRSATDDSHSVEHSPA